MASKHDHFQHDRSAHATPLAMLEQLMGPLNRFDATNKMQGRFVTLHPNGMPHECATFKDGVHTGLYEVWTDEGVLSIMCEGLEETNHEIMTKFYPDGYKMERSEYVNGELHGKQETFYNPSECNSRDPNYNFLKTRSTFAFGLLDGVHEKRRKDGSVESLTEYKAGKKHGKHEVFHVVYSPSISKYYGPHISQDLHDVMYNYRDNCDYIRHGWHADAQMYANGFIPIRTVATYMFVDGMLQCVGEKPVIAMADAQE